MRINGSLLLRATDPGRSKQNCRGNYSETCQFEAVVQAFTPMVVSVPQTAKWLPLVFLSTEEALLNKTNVSGWCGRLRFFNGAILRLVPANIFAKGPPE